MTRTHRGRATRARIVEAAAELMHVNGVAATSVDAVLVRAGAGKSQFYHAFRSRDDLVRAVLDYNAAAAEGRQRALLGSRPGWSGVRAWLDAIPEVYGGDSFRGGCPVGSMAAEVGDRDPDVRRRASHAFRTQAGILAHHLEGLRSTGELRPDADCEVLATAVVASIQGGLLLAATHGSGEPLGVALDAAWAHLARHRP
ncbi:MAG: TetR/AcrR family transcriptional regulator [Longimicrobiales bacterium]|nr:TetR/AcrR family transcriptional regulator [Longimicrobiales bacterium]